MVPSYRMQEMTDARTRLSKALAGAISTGIVLPDALKTEIESMDQTLQDNLTQYNQVLWDDEQERLGLETAQDSGLSLLRRVRRIVGAHLPKSERLATRQQYGVATIRSRDRERIWQMLTNINTVSENMTDDTLKVPAAVLTTVNSLAQSLQDGLEKRRFYRARQITLREERVALLEQYRDLRAKIYGFLMENMPEGSRDARLLAFGFRPSTLRRSPEAPEVLVVDETETETEPVTEPVATV